MSMIIFEWHAFMDGAINDDINDISIFEGCEGFGDMDGSVLFESFSELMSSFSSVSV